ncbi:MAG TPA: S1/P1 nuclease [Blastocatellia bacterium]|nr:S1/P1 nuclease [Blastocatellia bacterium]
MKQRTVGFLVAVCLVLLASMTSLGWGPGGHMMVASIAFNRLNPKAKAQVKRLLAIPINPCNVTRKSPDFVNAAHWADDVRPNLGFEFAPDLHFADFPFVADNTPAPTDLPKPQNVIKALEHYVEILKTSIDTNEQAEALRFVIHFVGDIHQPLHCATKVDGAHHEGDEGGNLLHVKVGGQDMKLHSYWDGGLGSFPKGGPPPKFIPPALRRIPPAVAVALQGHPDTDPDLKLGDPFNYQAWAKESRDLAEQAAYKDIAAGLSPTPQYVTRGLEVVRKRVAFAGYRLAALLNAIWQDSN